jgi:hypothetical protein
MNASSFLALPVDNNGILNYLSTHPFVKSATALGDDGFAVELYLETEAADVFVQYLSGSRHGQASYATDAPAGVTSTVHLAGGSDKRLFKRELTLAFSKVSQCLAYRERRQEYAPGGAPRHLTQWLLEHSALF